MKVKVRENTKNSGENYRSQEPRQSLCFVSRLLGCRGSADKCHGLPGYILPGLGDPMLSLLYDFRSDNGLPFATLTHSLDPGEDAGEG